MKLIFCKSTENRQKSFQIYTCIMQGDDQQRYVVKKAVYDEGNEHIEQMYRNYQLLKQIWQDQVAGCYRVADGMAFSYIEGKTYAEYVREELGKDDSTEHWNSILKDWKNLLMGRTDNLTKFDNSSEFQKIFGDAEQLKGDTALKITNFDCIAENMIMADDRLYFIDYEWVFDFPIPLDFCFFRILRQFSIDNQGKYNMERLLEASEITDSEKIQEYERLLDNFDMYVTRDRETNVLYPALGKFFKQPKIVSEREEPEEKYVFPESEVIEGSRLVLYGAGDVGMSFHRHLKTTEKYRLIKWIDKKYEQYREYGYDVSAVQSVMEVEYDHILLAVYNENTAEEISRELQKLGIKTEKILWVKPHRR